VGYSSDQIKLQWGVMSYGYCGSSYACDIEVHLDNINVFSEDVGSSNDVCVDVLARTDGTTATVTVDTTMRTVTTGNGLLVSLFRIFPEYEILDSWYYILDSEAQETEFVNAMADFLTDSVVTQSVVRVGMASMGAPLCGAKCQDIIRRCGGKSFDPSNQHMVLYGRLGARDKSLQMKVGSHGETISVQPLEECQYQQVVIPENSRTHQAILPSRDLSFSRSLQVSHVGAGVGVGNGIFFGEEANAPIVENSLDTTTGGRLGCFLDSLGRHGDFDTVCSYSQSTASPQMCHQCCSEMGHPFFALRWYHSCYCGRNYNYQLSSGESTESGNHKVEDYRCYADARGDRSAMNRSTNPFIFLLIFLAAHQIPTRSSHQWPSY
jgi:hypothetical protein